MKKTLLALALGALLAPAAFAGFGYGPNADRLADRLNLTPEQKAQVEQIIEKQQGQRQALRGQTHDQIRAVLTEEQRAQFDQMQANRPYEDCPRYGGPGPGQGYGMHRGEGHGPGYGMHRGEGHGPGYGMHRGEGYGPGYGMHHGW